MAVIYFGSSENVMVEEDAAAVEMAIRKAREDRTTFVELTLEGGDAKTWINADRILRFAETSQ
jgi:hypothetical protein